MAMLEELRVDRERGVLSKQDYKAQKDALRQRKSQWKAKHQASGSRESKSNVRALRDKWESRTLEI